MDILKPPVIRIGNRRYRKNQIADKNDTKTSNDKDHDEILDGECFYGDSGPLDDLDFTTTENGLSLAMSVPNAYFKFIIGKKGETKKRLEVETKTRIRIPNMGEDGDIVISGHDKALIASAKTRIELLISSQRHRQSFTHFLAFPLNNDVIQFNFEEFKQDVLRECHAVRGIDETIMQNPFKMHLTIGTLVLLNQAEIDEAAEVLQACQEDVVKSGSAGIKVRVKGLEYMNDDPGDVDVLYAKVVSLDHPRQLETLTERIAERFMASGLMAREHDRVKLHMTVINSLIRRDPGSGGVFAANERQRMRERESFDATQVLAMFGDYDFGEYVIPRVDLCQRYGTTCHGYYNTQASLSLS